MIRIFRFLLLLLPAAAASCQNAGKTYMDGDVKADTAAYNLYIDSATVLYNRAAYGQSLWFATKAVSAASELRDTTCISDALSYMLADYQQLGMQDSAISVARRLLEMDRKTGDIDILSNDYHNLAYIYIVSKKYELATEFIEKAIEMEKTIAGQPRISSRYALAAEAYNQLAAGRTDSIALREKALDFINKAYDIDFRRSDTLHFARRLSIKGDILAAMKKTAGAEKCYRDAIPMLESLGERHSLAITYRQLGALLLMCNNTNEAIQFLEKAMAVAKDEGELYTLMKGYQQLSEAYKDIDAQKYHDYLRLYTQTKDSVYTLESARSLSEFYARYETDKEKENAAGKHRKLVITVILSVVEFVIFVAFIAWMYVLLRQRNRHNRLLREQILQLKRQMEEQQQQFLKQMDIKEADIPEEDQQDKAFLESVNKAIFDIMGREDLTAGNVASSLCITSQQLRRRIKAIKDVTTIDYINSVRMEYARQVLRERRDLSIVQIGQLCGFYEATHFTRFFKRVTGFTPGEFRKKESF